MMDVRPNPGREERGRRRKAASPFHPSASGHQRPRFSGPSSLLLHLLCTVVVVLLHRPSHAQQPYENNKQLNCDATNTSSTLGYSCDAVSGPRFCRSFVMLRSQASYTTPITIGYLLNAKAADVARVNGVNDVDAIPLNALVIAPLDCSCSGHGGGLYYQHDANYIIKYTGETYFGIANTTYQGLSTCQALMAQNLYDKLELFQGMKLSIPLRCSCPSKIQRSSGIRYLLSYLVTWKDDVFSIADRFNISPQAVLEANNLAENDTIYPFTTVLVPLSTEPTKAETVSSPPPPPTPPAAPTESSSGGGGFSKNRWIFVGVGIGAVLELAMKTTNSKNKSEK